ncbi:MAG: bifunctional glutamate N-acetyltransferase/amino-acid acetyltransferase ArgJ [Thermodesulfobacteriota bacterium]
MIVPGFKAAAVAAGLKYQDRPDLGLIVAERPVDAAGVFTRSVVQAAPVLWCRERLAGGRAAAILVNAGQANACTGPEGRRAAEASARAAARAVGCRPEEVLLASTGVIGAPLNLPALEKALPALAAGLKEDGLEDTARAIMTTDTRPKTAVAGGEIEGRLFTVAGLAKGSGMIAPDMATMLSFILTDAAVEAGFLREVLTRSARQTFNCVTVDGDTSTNDCVLALAGGRAGNLKITGPSSPGAVVFEEAFLSVAADLAKMIAADGEGATKLVLVRVDGAPDADQARLAALTVANSPLVKTALFGEDANWGRLMMALGRSGAAFDPEKVDISLDEAPLVRDGRDAGHEAAAAQVMKKKEFAVNINLKAGPGRAAIWTCDFSYDYVKINANYRS